MSNNPPYGTLYLIPNTLGGDDAGLVIPPAVREKIIHLSHFVVENEKAARRFLKTAGILIPQSDIQFIELEKHEALPSVKTTARFLLEGHDTGLISDAGSPAVADPGAGLVRFAHEHQIRVAPLTGPSSLLMALAGSGLNGQRFCFHGYLPVTKSEKISRLKELERESRLKKQTQLFIETPYRNNALFQDILQACQGNTLVCIACDLTLPTEFIKTKPVSLWKKIPVDLHKRPTVFLLLQP